MRFSTIFESRALRSAPAEEGVATAAPVIADKPAPVPAELPEDLDQRVRQVGEWQLDDW
jgi:hypothetical protein